MAYKFSVGEPCKRVPVMSVLNDNEPLKIGAISWVTEVSYRPWEDDLGTGGWPIRVYGGNYKLGEWSESTSYAPLNDSDIQRITDKHKDSLPKRSLVKDDAEARKRIEELYRHGIQSGAGIYLDWLKEQRS